MISLTGVDADEVLTVLGTGIWNAEWYLRRYPDVAESGVNPLLHYLVQGWRESRSPGPQFDAQRYFEEYLEGIVSENPVVHFARNGRGAGQAPRFG